MTGRPAPASAVLLTRRNPYTALATMAARNPRAAVFVTGSGVAVFGMALLIAISSAQAFVVMSGQSADSTRGRLALLADRGGAAEQDLAMADGGAAAAGTPARGQAPTEPVGPGEIVSIYGIRVHRSIAADIRDLIDAAAADGVQLAGWGWRDNQTQIRLRRQHCGTSEYAIYRMPSSRCRPPTARPGRSQHERGLAIDFTSNGRSISTRNNAGFRWLAANAAAYGLKNLASEPWHWSTTGR